jgi:hypothetical protein
VADKKDRLGYEFLKQRTRCGKVFVPREDCEDHRQELRQFAGSRAHKGFVLLIAGLLSVLVSLGAGQFYWTQKLHGRQQDKIHKLEVDTALQLRELQARQEVILQGITDLRTDLRVLTGNMTEGR